MFLRKGIFILILSVLTFLLKPALAEKPVLKICTHYGFEPYIIRDNNKLYGIDIDIVVNILKKYRQSAHIDAYPWRRLLALLENGQCDIGFSLFDTPERRDKYDFIFTIPMHYSTFSVFTRSNTNFEFNNVSDFFGKTIAHNRGFALSVGLEQAIADKKINRVTFDNLTNAIAMLEANRIDAVVDNEARFRYYLKQEKKQDKISALTIPFMPHQPSFMVFSRKSTYPTIKDVRKKFETELKAMHLNGTILRITSEYLN
jgi:polar amino acid transport system substrate-binding protein